jgi:hypothetical protein
VSLTPRSIVAAATNLQRWTVMSGVLVVSELREFFRELIEKRSSAFGVTASAR